jgi:hypothetical protein
MPSRSQKRLSTYQQVEPKPYEGLLGKKLANVRQDTNRNNSQDYLQERISASPLKLPLSRAIEKTVKNMNK